MLWIPITGSFNIRSDSFGDGAYGARRKKWDAKLGKHVSYRHEGIDLVAVPSEIGVAPIDDFVMNRIVYPYQGDFDFKGVAFSTPWCSGKILYLNPFNDLMGQTLKIGHDIGIIQDISQKYGSGMVPHVHFQIDNFNPMMVM